MGRFLEGMDDPKDEFDQLHPIKMLFLNALVSEGRPAETRHMPRWWNLEFSVWIAYFLFKKCENKVEKNTDFRFLPRLVPRRDDKIKIKI